MIYYWICFCHARNERVHTNCTIFPLVVFYSSTELSAMNDLINWTQVSKTYASHPLPNRIWKEKISWNIQESQDIFVTMVIFPWIFDKLQSLGHWYFFYLMYCAKTYCASKQIINSAGIIMFPWRAQMHPATWPIGWWVGSLVAVDVSIAEATGTPSSFHHFTADDLFAHKHAVIAGLWRVKSSLNSSNE